MPDPRKFLFNSQYGTDKIIARLSSSDLPPIVLGPNGGTSEYYDVGITDNAFFEGYFWLEGYDTVAPFNGWIRASGDYSDYNTIFAESVRIYIYKMTGGTVQFIFSNNDDNNTHTIHFEAFFFAKSNQGPVEVPSTSKMSFNTSYNYFKIAKEGIEDIPSLGVYSGTEFTKQTITVPHNLGYSPFFTGFTEHQATLSKDGFNTNDTGPRFIASQAYVDDTNLYIEVINSDATYASLPGKYHYRIYYDS